MKKWKQPIPTNFVEICKGHKPASLLFIIFLLRAKNEAGYINIDNQQIYLKRGQCFCGKFELAKYFGLEHRQAKRIERYIFALISTHLITKQKSRNGSIITIKNYDKLISMSGSTTQPMTQRRPINDPSTTTNKSDKNVKNEKNDSLSSKKKTPLANAIIALAYKKGSRKYKPFFHDYEMRWSQNRWFVIVDGSDKWKKFAGEEEQITWKLK